MRFFPIFSIFLLFFGFSESYGAEKRAIDMRTDYLLGAILSAGSVDSMATLRKFFSEVHAGNLHASYDDMSSTTAKSYILGWKELRAQIAGSLKKMKFTKGKGMDLALSLSAQFGMSVWRLKGYRGSADLRKDPDIAPPDGQYVFPKQWAVVDSDLKCGQLFRGLVEMHWNDESLNTIMLRVIRAMDRQMITRRSPRA